MGQVQVHTQRRSRSNKSRTETPSQKHIELKPHCSRPCSTAQALSAFSLSCFPASAGMAMMSFFSRSKLLSHLHPQDLQGSMGANPSRPLQSRALHIDLGAREKALLEEDPALKRFKSHKRNVWRLKRLGDALTIVVVAGCCWEIYVRAELKKAAREKEETGSG